MNDVTMDYDGQKLRILLPMPSDIEEDQVRAEAWHTARYRCDQQDLVATNLELLHSAPWREARHAEWTEGAYDDVDVQPNVCGDLDHITIYCFEVTAKRMRTYMPSH